MYIELPDAPWSATNMNKVFSYHWRFFASSMNFPIAQSAYSIIFLLISVDFGLNGMSSGRIYGLWSLAVIRQAKNGLLLSMLSSSCMALSNII